MGTWEIIGGIAAIVTIIGGVVGATKAGRKWIKSTWKYHIRRKSTLKKLSKLADEKYQIEKEKIDKEIPIQEADLKEKAGLRGLRWSSVLVRELLELNLTATKKKIVERYRIDKEIIYSKRKLSEKDDVFLYDRSRETAKVERQALKQRLESIYRECPADNLLNIDSSRIDQEIDTLLRDMMTNLLIDKETL